MKFLALILFCTTGWAYTDKDINLSDYEYSRYVKPGLKEITKDYFAIYQSLNPEITNSYTQFKLHSEIRTELKKLEQTTEIEVYFKSIEKIKEISQTLLKANSKTINTKEKDHSTPNNYLIQIEKKNDYFQHILSFRDLLDKIILLPNKSDFSPFIIDLTNEHMLLESKFFKFLNAYNDNRFKKEFSAFETDFIRSVQKYIVHAKDKTQFLHLLNQLNISLNKLNVVLTKRNKKITKQTKSILLTFHTRWNNILKITLRR